MHGADLQPGYSEEAGVLGVGALLPAGDDEHVDVAEESRHSVACFIGDQPFDDQHSAAPDHGLAAVAEDVDRPLVFPVVEHVGQHVTVRAARYLLEEIPSQHRASVG
jgi:hypothetical protein